MGKLIYIANTSLDGYIEDATGAFDWGAPDEELHAYINDLVRSVGTHLNGRRLYETMVVWETLPTDDEPAVMGDFAELWRAADKIVYSRTLATASSARTRIEREFDPAAVARLKQSVPHDLLVGGAELASQAIAAGLVDECRVLVRPIVVGSGKPAFAPDIRCRLELVDEQRLSGGVVDLHYAVRT